jgi:hypothetical protein
MTTCAQAIKTWETANPDTPANEAEWIKLYSQQPPIAKLDGSLNSLVNCE